MKNRKMKYLFVWVMILVVGFQASLLFQVSVAAASDNYSPQNSDYAMSVSVDLSNLSIYQVDNGNTTAANITAKISATQPRLLMYYPEAQIFSGSSPQAVLFSYNHLMSPSQQGLITDVPTITSFSIYGYRHIDSMVPLNFGNGLLYKINGLNSMDAIQAFSSVMASHYGIMSLKSMNANFSESDFNNQIGQQTTQSLKFAASDTLNGNTSVYDNMSTVTFDGDVDPSFAVLQQQLTSATDTGIVTTQELNPNVDQQQKQQTFFAGYNNFDNEAIQTPVKDYAIQALASQGIYLSTDQLMLNYTSMNDIRNNVQVSQSLRNHILSPYTNTSSGTFGVLEKIDLSFLGINIFSTKRVDACWGICLPKLPKINTNAIVNGVVHTATSSVKSVTNLPHTVVSTAKSFTKDTSATLFNAVMHNPVTNTVNTGLKAASSFTGSIIKGAASLPKTLGNIGTSAFNLAKKGLNPASWMGSIFSTAMSFLKPFLPYILLGLGVLAVAAIIYFFGPTIIGGILMKKK